MFAYINRIFLPGMFSYNVEKSNRTYDPPCEASRKRRSGDKLERPRSAARQRRDRRRAGPEAAFISGKRERAPDARSVSHPSAGRVWAGQSPAQARRCERRARIAPSPEGCSWVRTDDNYGYSDAAKRLDTQKRKRLKNNDVRDCG